MLAQLLLLLVVDDVQLHGDVLCLRHIRLSGALVLPDLMPVLLDVVGDLLVDVGDASVAVCFFSGMKSIFPTMSLSSSFVLPSASRA